MSFILCAHALFALLNPVLAKPTAPIDVKVGFRAGPSYHLRDSHQGADFFQAFRWENANDPTHGRVNYLDQQTAIQKKLSYAEGSKFFMRADSTRKVTSGRGRDSVRISSYDAFDDGILVLDVEHMPTGCGTWPAFWTKSQNNRWPIGGEIDIIEGVNSDQTNLAGLHTTPNCEVPEKRDQTGTTRSTNCDTSFNYNQGCGTRFRSPQSYGKPFNDNRGGWYVLQKSPDAGIKVWFWPRSSSVPEEIRNGKSSITPNQVWGTPDAYFPLDSCDYESHFDAHKIIINLTFCGDWAGDNADWPASTCAAQYGSSCVDFVDNNPSAFSEAYWEINSLRVYVPAEEIY